MAHMPFYGESSVRDYFTGSRRTIPLCGLVAYAAIVMYRTDRLKFLATQCQLPALLGGICLLLLVVLRSVAVWKEARQLQELGQGQGMTCSQDHVHTADCCA